MRPPLRSKAARGTRRIAGDTGGASGSGTVRPKPDFVVGSPGANRRKTRRPPTTAGRAISRPRAWKLSALKAELRTHLRLTTDEAVARLGHDWSADVVAYDRIHRHALHGADILSSGLVKQFPRRFGR